MRKFKANRDFRYDRDFDDEEESTLIKGKIYYEFEGYTYGLMEPGDIAGARHLEQSSFNRLQFPI